jgi:predicted permease
MAAAVLLAYVPRLPSPHAPAGLGLATGGVRITPGTNRRLRVFATMQIACSFVLLAGAGMLLATLVALQSAKTGFNVRQVLAFDIPAPVIGVDDGKVLNFYQEVTRRVGALPGVDAVAVGSNVPWRDAGGPLGGGGFQFAAEGYQQADGEASPRARMRMVGSGFFDVLGVPIVAGRDFTDDDRGGREPVSIVSQSIAQRLFPNGDAVNRHITWTDPVFSLYGKPIPRRVVGVVADVDDESVVPGAPLTIYQPVRQMGLAGRLFVRTAGDPYAVVPSVTRVVRELSADQPVERAATLEDIRAEVMSPERVNAFVFSGFAGIALLIAVVGVAGVLAFSVSARTREFGIRLAVGSAPRHLLGRVLSEGVGIATIGIVAGAAGGYALTFLAGRLFAHVQLPGALTVIVSAAVLITAAVVASFMPAARASRIDVLQALRSE